MDLKNNCNLRIKYLVNAFFAIAVSIFLVVLIQFYLDLDGYSSLYSSGGVTAPLQLFYNFQNGRPFQTSLFATIAAGNSVGFTYNPYPYLHIFAIHVYLTPFIFSYIWNIFPNIYWLYGLVILVNYLSIFIFIYLILKKYSYNSIKIKFIFLSAVVLASGALYTFLSHAQLLMFSAPFLFMAIYFAINNKIFLYFLSIILLSGISEDAILFAAMLSIYFSINTNKQKKYYLLIGLFSIIYFIVCIFIIQPMARVELTNVSLNTTLVVLEKILYLHNRSISEIIISIAPALSLIPAFFLSYCIFGKSELKVHNVLMFAFIPSLFHLGESIVVGAGHHLAPVIYIIIAALTLYVAKTQNNYKYEGAVTIRWVIIAILIIISFIISLRVYASFAPRWVLLPALSALGKDDIKNRLTSNREEQNRALTKYINALSPEDSVSYYANIDVDGFLAGRKKIWRFPDFYENVKYLIIQKDASNASFSISKDETLNLNEAIWNGFSADSIGEHYISSKDVERVVNYLVKIKGTHTIDTDCEEYVVLMNKSPDILDNDPSTHGLGWLIRRSVE